MFFELGAVAFGLLVSFFLKDINFLGLNFAVLHTGLVYPDFLLIFVVFFALHKREFSGLWIGFFAGLLEDSGIIRFSDSSGEFLNLLGVHALVYTLVGFTLGKISRFVDKESSLPILFILFFTALVTRIAIWFLMGVVNEFNDSYPFFIPAVYTAAVSPLWFAVLSWVYKASIQEEK